MWHLSRKFYLTLKGQFNGIKIVYLIPGLLLDFLIVGKNARNKNCALDKKDNWHDDPCIAVNLHCPSH